MSSGFLILFAMVFSLGASGWTSAQQHRGAAWPDTLTLADGSKVSDTSNFELNRRPEILNLFEDNVYGKTPAETLPIRVVDIKVDHGALNGLARRIQFTVVVGAKEERSWHLLEYLPEQIQSPVAVFVGLNFDGNQTVDADPGIDIHPVWVPDPALKDLHLAKELSRHTLAMPSADTRGRASSQWQVREIVSRGYGLATVYAGDIEPDFIGGIGYGVRPLFFSPAQSLPAADNWGAIGAWAWGMSRIVDVLSKQPEVDSSRLIAFGFSRFGKTALWAAAQDRRFAAVISSESGQAGATLSHRRVGEPIDHLMLAFPYWFCANYQHYLGRVSDLPADGHMLLALIAPRPLYVTSAIADPFSDPEGEFLASQDVSRVYALYGKRGITEPSMPSLNRAVGAFVRYHVRPGGHDVTAYDWEQYLNFADQMLRPALNP